MTSDLQVIHAHDTKDNVAMHINDHIVMYMDDKERVNWNMKKIGADSIPKHFLSLSSESSVFPSDIYTSN
jgi:hypothetical protein